MSIEEREQNYNTALIIWDNLLDVTVKDANNLLESKKYPMHPSMFFELSQARGFNSINGNTYEEYVNKWKTRTHSSD
jgi:hypothetical protein